MGSNALANSIKEFSANIHLNKDGTLDVIENIVRDFGSQYKHGIYRNIPIKFTRNHGNYQNDFKIIDITNGNGQTLPYSSSVHGNDVVIKIGKPDELVTGVNLYRLHYRVNRIINFFQNQPELYWNVTGADWPVTIHNVTCKFYPPASVNIDSLKADCFLGEQGSKQRGNINKETANLFFSTPKLYSGEQMTILVRLPANSVVKASALQELCWLIRDWYPAFALPIFTSIIMFALWWHLGRDPESVGAISVEWEPPKDLTPAEVGTLVDESCDTKDIVSTVIDLAARGYLKIRELPASGFLFFSGKDYEFTKLDLPQDAHKLNKYEDRVMHGIFGLSNTTVYLSQLKNTFYTNLPLVSDAIYESLITKDCFTQNPQMVKKGYYVLGILGICLGVIFFIAGISSSVAWGIGTVLSGIIICCASGAMPVRTKTGVSFLRQSLAYKRFVRMAEKDRLRVLAEKDPTIFGRLLPYAMVLGVENQWAEKFHDLITAPPSWYEPLGYGSTNYIFSSNTFVNDLGYSMTTMGSTFVSQPMPTSSSSGAGGGFSGFSDGGGFSGGGFGGGGGGDW